MPHISLFEEKQVRRAWDADQQKWLFAIVDIIAILTNSPNPQTYWRVMEKRLKDEGNEFKKVKASHHQLRHGCEAGPRVLPAPCHPVPLAGREAF